MFAQLYSICTKNSIGLQIFAQKCKKNEKLLIIFLYNVSKIFLWFNWRSIKKTNATPNYFLLRYSYP